MIPGDLENQMELDSPPLLTITPCSLQGELQERAEVGQFVCVWTCVPTGYRVKPRPLSPLRSGLMSPFQFSSSCSSTCTLYFSDWKVDYPQTLYSVPTFLSLLLTFYSESSYLLPIKILTVIENSPFWHLPWSPSQSWSSFSTFGPDLEYSAFYCRSVSVWAALPPSQQ